MPRLSMRLVASAAALFLVAGLPGAVLAQEGTAEKSAAKEAAISLRVGDAAPAMVVGEWVKGEPVKSFEAGKVYVVEFWATWCGPCKVSIPHLTEMQQQFKEKGVRFVGVSVWEQDQKEVAPFVKQMGGKMEYTVAMDKLDASGDGDKGAMATTWMKAAGQQGIPTAFVVDQQGKVAWIGHPMGGLDRVLSQVVAGTFDGKKFAAAADAENATKKQWGAAMSAAVGAKDWDKAISLLDERIAADPENADSLSINKYTLMLTAKKDVGGASALAKQLSEGPFKNNAEVLNELAWRMVDPEADIANRDNVGALKIAQRAAELTKSEEPAILDTLARCHFNLGDYVAAVKFQTMAHDKATGREKVELERTLKMYKEEAAKKGA